MKIQKYEIWMRQQVIELFQMEYGTDAEDFDAFFEQFYEHPFQESDGIRIAATDGDKVIGFQSFFHWPMDIGGKFTHAYQSGNSLVHPDYRGKGLFGKMLNYIHTEEAHMPHNLLIGFPVEMSFGAFMKNKWHNPFDLQWYIKPLRPLLAAITNPEKSLALRLVQREPVTLHGASSHTAVAQTDAYDSYRFAYQKGHYYRYTHQNELGTVLFEMKAQRRKKILKELIIGKVVRSNDDTGLLREAFEGLLKQINKSAHFSFVSIAINPLSSDFNQLVQTFGFRKIEKKIHFIAKGPIADQVEDWGTWEIFRADIDTW
jgi:GNAT superfamily N-acetyltransferase